MRYRWREVGLFAASLLFSLVLTEITIRMFLPEVSDTFVIPLDNPSEKYHHPLRASVPSPRDEAFRILFLGDSFTFGVCERNETFPHVVQELLQHEGWDVQSFNTGTPSYSPSIYGAILNDFAPLIKPHLVVVAVDDSDPQDDYLYRNLVDTDRDGLPISVYPELPGVPRALTPVARHVKLIRYPLGRWHQRQKQHRPVAMENSQQLGAYENRLGHYRPRSEQIWGSTFERSLSLVDAIVRYCRRHQIAVVLVNYPYAPAVTTTYNVKWRKQFGLDNSQVYQTIFHEYQETYARSNDIPYYDFTPYLKRLRDLAGFYHESDGHFTALANQHFARELVEFLRPLVSQPKPSVFQR